MDDKETNYRHVVKFTQVDPEWLLLTVKKEAGSGQRIRCFEAHTDVKQECQEK